MKLEMTGQMRLEQRMKLAPHMIQSMEILQLPILALQERIEQELNSNPVLEIDEPDDSDNEQAVQEQPERIVALKVLRPYVASRSALRRFQFAAQRRRCDQAPLPCPKSMPLRFSAPSAVKLRPAPPRTSVGGGPAASARRARRAWGPR